MKKYFLLFLFSLMILSCSKKNDVIITGKITGGSPLERLEIIEISGVSALPITNIGVDEKGNISDTVSINKNGIYLLSYGGKSGFIYLKGGDKINFTANGTTFPTEMKITGDAQANTEYLQESRKFADQYFSKLDQSLVAKDETAFIKELEKFKADITKKNDEIAKIKKPDSEVEKLNKKELDITILMISSQYENFHGQAINNPNFKVSTKMKEFQKKLENEDYITEMPTYRNYVLNTISKDFQTFMGSQKQTEVSSTEMLSKYLDTRKDLTETTKEYLLGTVASQYDLQPGNPKIDGLLKFLDGKIKNETIKKDLKRVEGAILGAKIGTDVSAVELIQQDGKKTTLSSLKGKPTLVMFYASWNPYFNEAVVPVVKEMVNFYKSKMNFAYINLDDKQSQFVSTSKAVFAGIEGKNLYGKGGLKSDIANQFSIYGFKMPSFVIIDKDGKVAGKAVLNVGDPELVNQLNKFSGLVAPAPQSAPMMPPPPPAVAGEHSANDGHGH